MTPDLQWKLTGGGRYTELVLKGFVVGRVYRWRARRTSRTGAQYKAVFMSTERRAFDIDDQATGWLWNRAMEWVEAIAA